MADKAFKLRAKRCEVHGLLFDPELTSGCVRCRRHGTRARQPKFLSLLLTLLALTAVGGYVINGAISRLRQDAAANDSATSSPVTNPDTAGGALRLDPERFGSPIRSLEDALFAANDNDVEVIVDQVAGTATSLANALRQAGAEQAYETVLVLATEARDGTPTLTALQAHRDRWVRMRNALFRPATWMASGTTRADAGQLAIHAHLQVAEALADLIANADAQGALDTDAAALRAQMPSTPAFDADPQLLTAHQTLTQTLDDVSGLATITDPADRRQALDDLASQVADTESVLEGLLSS